MRSRKPRAGRSAFSDAMGPAKAGLAQLVERQFCKLDVAGSIPAAGTIDQPNMLKTQPQPASAP
jgi:hypothetical protein